MPFFQNKQPKRTVLGQGYEDFPRQVTAKIKSFFHALRLPLAILAGSALTAGTTYLLIKHVQRLLAHTSVNASPSYWQHKARIEAYDACYNGCPDIHCHDLDFAYKACRKTALASDIAGVECDGRSMWNWRDRYPTACLEALGGMYRDEALREKKMGIRNQLALIILTILAGVIAGIVVWKVWGCMFGKSGHENVRKTSPLGRDEREREQGQQQQWPSPAPSSPAPPAYEEIELEERSNSEAFPQHNSTPRSECPKSISNAKWKSATLLAMLGLGAQSASAERCWGYDSYTQHFTNFNRTIAGTIHGWTGDCTVQSYICGEKCSGDSCTPTWCSHTVLSTSPAEMVRRMGERASGCGFVMVSGVVKEMRGIKELGVRVPNPRFEKDNWVRVGVNGFNVTRGEKTDSEVRCLWDLGGPVY